MKNLYKISLLLLLLSIIISCSGIKREKITKISQLKGKLFAVPTGTMADQLVMEKIPNVKFKYFNSVIDCAMSVKANKTDAAAYDEPILKNIAAKNSGLKVLSPPIVTNEYGYAVNMENKILKIAIDELLEEMVSNGEYDSMKTNWLPEKGEPGLMPQIVLSEENGTLRFGTCAITEPFAFLRGCDDIVGLDIEIALRVAEKMGMNLEIVDMKFGSLIPALMAGKVDFIGACITISEERSKKVLFSNPYYIGGISALVKE